jgi:hypothetical protein
LLSLTKLALLCVGKMGDNAAAKIPLPHHQVFDVSADVRPHAGSKCFDDDGRLKRTGELILLARRRLGLNVFFFVNYFVTNSGFFFQGRFIRQVLT